MSIDLLSLPLRTTTRGKRHTPPFTAVILEEVSMADGLEILSSTVVSYERSCWVALVWTSYVPRARYDSTMAKLSATFCNQKVVPIVFLVYMWSFGGW